MRKHASREIISASVELCENEVCFLHIQLIGTNVRLPNLHRIPPDVDFESSKVSCKIRSLETNLVCIVVLRFHTTILPVFNCVMNVRGETRQTFVTSFCPLCDRTNKFVYLLSNVRSTNSCQIQSFQNNCEETLDNSPTDPFSSSVN